MNDDLRAGVYGPAVDDAINQAVYGQAEEPAFSVPMYGVDPVKSTVAALEIIERHLVPVRSRDLAALALLRIEAEGMGADGTIFTNLADGWEKSHQKRGPAGPLLQAMEYASAFRLFKGTVGGGGGGGRAGGGGGLFGGGRR